MHIETLEAPYTEEPLLTLCANLEPSWIDPIIQYLRSDTLSTDVMAIHKIRCMAPHYTLVDG